MWHKLVEIIQGLFHATRFGSKTQTRILGVVIAIGPHQVEGPTAMTIREALNACQLILPIIQDVRIGIDRLRVGANAIMGPSRVIGNLNFREIRP